MGKEIDLLVNYPKTKRDVKERGNTKTEEDRTIARKFGRDFFDGDRKHGYGGFGYLPRFWQPVIPTFKEHFNLDSSSSLLDVGCAKGFMLYDLIQIIPGITVSGVDISEYAIENAIDSIKPHVQVAKAMNLPFEDNSFDVVIAINTLHNLEKADFAVALREVERVSRKGAFVTVDAFRDEEEKEAMLAWNLTAKTILSVDEWISFYDECSYSGDYYWFMP